MIRLGVGDRFKSLLTGKVFEVKSFTDWVVTLESGDKLRQVLTERENLKLFYQKVAPENQPDLTRQNDPTEVSKR